MDHRAAMSEKEQTVPLLLIYVFYWSAQVDG